MIADEEDNRPLNQLVMMELGGEITRLDYEDVEKMCMMRKKLKIMRKKLHKDLEGQTSANFQRQ